MMTKTMMMHMKILLLLEENEFLNSKILCRERERLDMASPFCSFELTILLLFACLQNGQISLSDHGL